MNARRWLHPRASLAITIVAVCAVLLASASHARAWQGGQSITAMLEAAEVGSTITVPPGVYRERIRIQKSVRLIGSGNPVIDGGGSGDIVEITAADVTLRGFVIRNTGTDLDKENAAIRVLAPRATIEDNDLQDILFGIDLRDAPNSIIRNNRIGGKQLDIARRGDGLRTWRSDQTLIERNRIHDGRDSILWYSRGITFRDNTAIDCRYGLHLMFSDDIRIESNRFTGNSVAIYLMYSTGVHIEGNLILRNRGPSGYGIGLKETDDFTVTRNLIASNRVGIYIDGSPFTGKKPGAYHHNTIAYNDVGVTFLPSARNNEFTQNNFVDNIDQVSVAGRGNLDANRFWKGDIGNFWSDYTGYDQNRDGVGDFVHESQTLFDNMMDRDPRMRLFLFSPTQHAIEFVGRAMPTIRPEPKFVDEVPLMRPVAIDFSHLVSESTIASTLLTGSALFGVGLTILLLARTSGGPNRAEQRKRVAAS